MIQRSVVTQSIVGWTRTMLLKKLSSTCGSRKKRQLCRWNQAGPFVFVLLLVLISVKAAQAQQSTTNPSSTASSQPTSSKDKAEKEQPPSTAASSPEPENIWTREELTGDWAGMRKKWEEHGVRFELSWTNFFQGVASGGLEPGFAYGGKLTGEMTLDTTKLGWWKNGQFQVKVDNRYGDSASEFTGSLFPVNTGLFVPKESGTATSVTAFNYTHIFPLSKPGDMVLLSLGRFDTLDLVVEPLIGASGINKFMNVNHVAPPHEGRNVPLVTWGWTMAWVRKGEPFFTVAFLDSGDSSTTTGLSRLFEQGVTMMPAIILPTHFGGKAGHQGIRASWSNQTVTPFDQLRALILPLPDRPVQRKSGSWSVTYSFDQYFHEIPGFPRKGWGLFGQVGFADRRTNPIQTFIQIGIGGNSPFKKRPRDLFGIAYSFNSISGDLKDAVDPLVRLRNEHEFEAFYNFALAPWMYISPDFQVMRPARPRAEFAFVPGARLKFVF
jgi:porin